MRKFLPNAVISKEHGNIYERSGRVYFLMYHPAVALYKGSMRSVLLEDFKTLRSFLDGDEEAKSLDDTVSSIIAEKESSEKTVVTSSSDGDQVGMDL